jgi:hypothetical protein
MSLAEARTYPLACDRSERFKRSLVCTSSPLCSLRPCRTAILSILPSPLVSVLNRNTRSVSTPAADRSDSRDTVFALCRMNCLWFIEARMTGIPSEIMPDGNGW